MLWENCKVMLWGSCHGGDFVTRGRWVELKELWIAQRRRALQISRQRMKQSDRSMRGEWRKASTSDGPTSSPFSARLTTANTPMACEGRSA